MNDVRFDLPPPSPERVLVTPPPAMPASKSVLVVDDDRLWLSAISRILEREGFRVATASNASSALKTLRENEVDLIVSDLNMPRMDGLELRDALLSDAGKSAIPFIFMSGVIDADSRRTAKNLGVTHVLEKTGVASLSQLAHDLAGA